jgi:hypothetical protein
VPRRDLSGLATVTGAATTPASAGNHLAPERDHYTVMETALIACSAGLQTCLGPPQKPD